MWSRGGCWLVVDGCEKEKEKEKEGERVATAERRGTLGSRNTEIIVVGLRDI